MSLENELKVNTETMVRLIQALGEVAQASIKTGESIGGASEPFSKGGIVEGRLQDASVQLGDNRQSEVVGTKAAAAGKNLAQSLKGTSPEAPTGDVMDTVAAGLPLAHRVKTQGEKLLVELAGRSPEAAKDLLESFGVTKFSQLKPGINVFQDFAKRCGDKLATLLHEATYKSIVPGAESPKTVVPTQPEYTTEDVRQVIIALCNNPELGREAAAKALATVGAKGISEVTADQFSDVISAGNKMLGEVAK